MEKKINIAFFVTNDLLTDQRMHRICSTLQDTGKWEVVLVGKNSKRVINTANFTFRIKRINLLFKKGKLFYLFTMLRFLMYGLIKKIDVVCSVDADTILPCHFIAKWKGVKHVHDAHELFTQVPELINRPLHQRIWSKIEQCGVRSVSQFYTVSEGLAAYYAHIYSKPIEIIRNLPNLKATENKVEIMYDVAYQGAINAGRGVLELIEAANIGDFSVCIIGEGDLSENVKEQAIKSKNVTYLGMILPEKLHQHTQQSLIGFNVLDNSSKSYDESLPNKTFDYMMAGLPQLISNSNALSVLNDDYNFALVCAYNPKSIADKVKLLLNDKTNYNRLKANALKASKTFNWENESKKLLKIYQNLES